MFFLRPLYVFALIDLTVCFPNHKVPFFAAVVREQFVSPHRPRCMLDHGLLVREGAGFDAALDEMFQVSAE